MERSQLMQIVLAELESIAPEVQAQHLKTGSPLREQVDLDSMDWLNFLIALHRRLKVDIPEADYASLRSLDNVVDYLAARAA